MASTLIGKRIAADAVKVHPPEREAFGVGGAGTYEASVRGCRAPTRRGVPGPQAVTPGYTG